MEASYLLFARWRKRWLGGVRCISAGGWQPTRIDVFVVAFSESVVVVLYSVTRERTHTHSHVSMHVYVCSFVQTLLLGTCLFGYVKIWIGWQFGGEIQMHTLLDIPNYDICCPKCCFKYDKSVLSDKACDICGISVLDWIILRPEKNARGVHKIV